MDHKCCDSRVHNDSVGDTLEMEQSLLTIIFAQENVEWSPTPGLFSLQMVCSAVFQWWTDRYSNPISCEDFQILLFKAFHNSLTHRERFFVFRLQFVKQIIVTSNVKQGMFRRVLTGCEIKFIPNCVKYEGIVSSQRWKCPCRLMTIDQLNTMETWDFHDKQIWQICQIWQK